MTSNLRSVWILLLAAVVVGQRPRPRIGLVLSGGGARGAAHVGVIQVLEELRIPVDYVVGTSMGSVVGGMYAAGFAPDEMVTILAEAAWETLLSDDPPREKLWFRRRQDNRRFLIDLEFGWRDGAPALPPGLVLGRNIEGFLEHLLLPVATVVEFDRLKLPFRCVATDIENGAPVVLASGSLAKAIRASMSIPGVFAPIEHQGRVLVDGGVVDNVPVGVARKLGAEVLIAVDISTPLADPATLRSLLSVSDQVIGILMNENRKRSMDSLRAGDIAIVPELGDLAVMEFERSLEAVRIGREAASALRDRLAPLGVDRATWDAFTARQRRRKPTPTRIRGLAIAGRTGFSDRVIREFVAPLHPGRPLDGAALVAAREQLGGLGVFERIDIEFAPVAEDLTQADVVLRPIEKGWGPHYLRFGLGAGTDMRGGGDFDFGVQHTWTPANSLGGEWRNEAQIGTHTRLLSEFYQPIDAGLRWFLAPAIEYEQRDVPIIVNRRKVAEVDVEAATFGLAFGRNLGSWGEIRVGYGWLDGAVRPEIAIPGVIPPRTNVEFGRFESRFLIDTLDNLSFPRSGFVGSLDWEYTDESVGGDDRSSVISGSLGVPVSFGTLTMFPLLEGGTRLEGRDAIAGGEFSLGGFQRLSGLEPRELAGDHYVLGALRSYCQMSERTTRFGMAMYVGATVELGGIWHNRSDVGARDLLFGGSVFVAVDSILGPAYVAFGVAEGGERAAYVFIGPSF